MVLASAEENPKSYSLKQGKRLEAILWLSVQYSGEEKNLEATLQSVAGLS